MPGISVVMPVYNTPVKYLEEAVESILNQTFQDFEFIIIDDGSTDETVKQYLNEIQDARVRVLRNEKNIGITKSLNVGLRAAQGKYIARMDSDDISLPMRFEKQYCFMETHPETILCGTNVFEIGNRQRQIHFRIDDKENYRIKLLFYNPGPRHPTVFFRRSMLVENSIEYDERLRYAQDYMLWTRVYSVGDIHCLDEPLLYYRRHDDQVSNARQIEQIQCAVIVLEEQLSQLLDNVGDQDARNHRDYYCSRTISPEAHRWFMRLVRANRRRKVYDRAKFERFVTEMIVRKVYATYDIRWRNPKSYVILLRYLPPIVVLKEAGYRLRARLSKARGGGN